MDISIKKRGSKEHPRKRKSQNAWTAFADSEFKKKMKKNRRCGLTFLHGFLLSFTWAAVFLIEDEVIQVAPGSVQSGIVFAPFEKTPGQYMIPAAKNVPNFLG